jgi:hypothetical protein
MESNNILGITAIVISVISAAIGALNHTRVRSACCGRSFEASFDVEKTSEQVTNPQVNQTV